MNAWPAIRNTRTRLVTAIAISMTGLLLLLSCFTACTAPSSPTEPEVASPAKPEVTASEVTVPSVAGKPFADLEKTMLSDTVSRLSARMRSIATP